MKIRVRIIGISILIGLLTGLADTVVGYFMFYDKPFFDLMFFDIPAFEIYVRSIILIVFVISGFIVSGVIARHKQTEERLKEQKDFLDLVLNSLKHPFYVINPSDYTIRKANLAAIEGQLKKDTTCYALTHKRDSPCEPPGDLCPIEIIKRTKQPVTLEHIHYDRDGNSQHVEVHAYPVFDSEDNISEIIEYSINITERKQAEKTLRESESKLRQAQKMESIGTLAGGVAHEFNNILGIIIGNTELAIDDVPEWNPAAESLQEIRKASLRAKDVVRNILSFARKTPAQRKPIQISTIIRDSLKLMRASIPATIEIRQNISCESEMILADPTEINQILMNLCTNSAHALSEETGVLEVSLESVNLDKDSASQYENLDTGKFVKLTVKDTGEGIDPKIMDRVFDPYFTTGSLAESSGMGLAIVYGIVKKHDGAIKASSELGIGTVVEVLFPLTEETVEPEMKEEPEVLPTGTERILFVDDEESLVKMAKQMLGRLGYQVVTKTNPKEALALFKAEPDQFDAVITDMAMPQMAGDRLAQELMQIRKDIPVILCTGHSARIDEVRAKEIGIKAYAMKPLVTRDFANTVRKVLDQALSER